MHALAVAVLTPPPARAKTNRLEQDQLLPHHVDTFHSVTVRAPVCVCVCVCARACLCARAVYDFIVACRDNVSVCFKECVQLFAENVGIRGKSGGIPILVWYTRSRFVIFFCVAGAINSRGFVTDVKE